MTTPAGEVFRASLIHHSDGSWMAIANDLAGCYARAKSDSEALAGLVAAIPAYYDWLILHDDYTPRLSGAVSTQVIATLQLTPGMFAAFLPDDVEAINDEDLDWFLAVINWAYEDLLWLAANRPPTLERDKQLDIIAQVQCLYIAQGTGTPQPTLTAATALERVVEARDLALKAFRATSRSQREGINETNGQKWSLRSGLRSSVLLAKRGMEDFAAL